MSHFIFNPPIKWNSNVEINQFSSYKNANGEWYIVNSKVKVEIMTQLSGKVYGY